MTSSSAHARASATSAAALAAGLSNLRRFPVAAGPAPPAAAPPGPLRALSAGERAAPSPVRGLEALPPPAPPPPLAPEGGPGGWLGGSRGNAGELNGGGPASLRPRRSTFGVGRWKCSIKRSLRRDTTSDMSGDDSGSSISGASGPSDEDCASQGDLFPRGKGGPLGGAPLPEDGAAAAEAPGIRGSLAAL